MEPPLQAQGGSSIVYLNNCDLDYMPDLSETEKSVIFLSDNWITTLFDEYIPRSCSKFVASRNKIYSDGLPFEWPPRVEEIDLEHNYLFDTDGVRWPDGLKKLSLAANPLKVWPSMIPECLEYLNLEKTDIRTVDSLPASCKTFLASHCQIRQLPTALPDNLLFLNLSMNNLKLRGLPIHWGNSLKVLDLDDNRLAQFPEGLPDSLEVLKLRKNHIKLVPRKLPSNLTILALDRNCIRAVQIEKRRKPIDWVSLIDNELTESVRDYQERLHIEWAKHIEERHNWNEDFHKAASKKIRRVWRTYTLRRGLRNWRKTAILKDELLQASMHPDRAGRFENLSEHWGC